MEPPDIDLGICRLRPYRVEDAASIARHADDPEVWINLRDTFPHPYTIDDARAWLPRVLAASPANHLAIEVDGEFVGAIGCTPGQDVSSHSAEVGYWLGRAYWGRGIATAAVRAWTEHLLTIRGFRRLEATVFDGNPASSRVVEKAGYILEGRLKGAIVKDGRMIDGLLYAIVRA